MRGLVGFAITLAFFITGQEMFETAWAGVGCEIRASGTKNGKTLEAIISGSGPVVGSYSFRVERSSKSGVTVDSGNFEIQAGPPSEIKSAKIDLSPTETYRATLEVKWANGSSSCSARGG